MCLRIGSAPLLCKCFGSTPILISLVLLSAPLALTSCSGGSPGSSSSVATGTLAATVNPAVTAARIYSVDGANLAVDVYAANVNGTASPSSSYSTGPVLAVTGDAAGNIYIATYSNTLAAVQVYPAGSTTSSRSITVATASSNAPQISTIAVDSAGNLYVAISASIYVYAPAASGAATPIRTIAGSLTTFAAASPITQMAFDANNDLFVATGAGYKGSQVVEFPAGATGNIAPALVTSANYYPAGVALDTAGNIYISQGAAPSAYNGTYTPAIYVFPKGSVAGATPIRTITGSNLAIAIYAYQIFVDSAGNIFVGTTSNGQTDFLVYSAAANGNVAASSIVIRGRGNGGDSQFFVR